MADEPTQLTLCPHCGTPWPSGATVCPHCGYIQPRLPVWPPMPMGVAVSFLPPASKLVTGKAWGDVTLGLAVSFLSNFLFCAGFLVMPILYFMLKSKRPFFARGLGFGFLAGLVVLAVGVFALVAGLLGALSTCKTPT